MKIYKVIFAKNEVISCREFNKEVELTGNYKYEHEKGQLIYALIKAENEIDATNKSGNIVKEFNEKTFGNDFIS